MPLRRVGAAGSPATSVRRAKPAGAYARPARALQDIAARQPPRQRTQVLCLRRKDCAPLPHRQAALLASTNLDGWRRSPHRGPAAQPCLPRRAAGSQLRARRRTAGRGSIACPRDAGATPSSIRDGAEPLWSVAQARRRRTSSSASAAAVSVCFAPAQPSTPPTSTPPQPSQHPPTPTQPATLTPTSPQPAPARRCAHSSGAGWRCPPRSRVHGVRQRLASPPESALPACFGQHANRQAASQPCHSRHHCSSERRLPTLQCPQLRLRSVHERPGGRGFQVAAVLRKHWGGGHCKRRAIAPP